MLAESSADNVEAAADATADATDQVPEEAGNVEPVVTEVEAPEWGTISDAELKTRWMEIQEGNFVEIEDLTREQASEGFFSQFFEDVFGTIEGVEFESFADLWTETDTLDMEKLGEVFTSLDDGDSETTELTIEQLRDDWVVQQRSTLEFPGDIREDSALLVSGPEYRTFKLQEELRDVWEAELEPVELDAVEFSTADEETLAWVEEHGLEWTDEGLVEFDWAAEDIPEGMTSDEYADSLRTEFLEDYKTFDVFETFEEFRAREVSDGDLSPYEAWLERTEDAQVLLADFEHHDVMETLREELLTQMEKQAAEFRALLNGSSTGIADEKVQFIYQAGETEEAGEWRIHDENCTADHSKSGETCGYTDTDGSEVVIDIDDSQYDLTLKPAHVGSDGKLDASEFGALGKEFELIQDQSGTMPNTITNDAEWEGAFALVNGDAWEHGVIAGENDIVDAEFGEDDFQTMLNKLYEEEHGALPTESGSTMTEEMLNQDIYAEYDARGFFGGLSDTCFTDASVGDLIRKLFL